MDGRSSIDPRPLRHHRWAPRPGVGISRQAAGVRRTTRDHAFDPRIVHFVPHTCSGDLTTGMLPPAEQHSPRRSHAIAMTKVFLFLALIAISLTVINIEVDPPPQYRQPMFAEGRIRQCEMAGISSRKVDAAGLGKHFVGLTLDSPDTPLLRVNIPSDQLPWYESVCTRKARVRVEYTAKKRLVGPVRFWIQGIEERR